MCNICICRFVYKKYLKLLVIYPSSDSSSLEDRHNMWDEELSLFEGGVITEGKELGCVEADVADTVLKICLFLLSSCDWCDCVGIFEESVIKQ